MRRLAPSIAVLLVGLHMVSAAAGADLGLITGGAGGTYYQFGQDLKRLVKPAAIELTVHPSKGSVDNIFAVSEQRGVQLGIVQSDVLAFVGEQQGDPALSRITERIRMVFPLYDEEVHVLARRDITSFEQLAGKRVAIGAEGSGTYLTARWLFKLAEVRPGEMLALDGAVALADLKAGRIDALVYVAAHPVGFLQHQIGATDGLALVPIIHASILDAYAAVEIPADVYDWQPTAVRTVAVKAVLVSSDPSGPDCETLGRFARQVAAGMDWLAQHGHPTWKRVDVDVPLPGWEQSECVRKHMAGQTTADESPAASAAERNPVADAIKDALDRR